MTLEQITADLLRLPAGDRAKLAKTLADSVDDFTDGRIEKSWDETVSSRIDELESGEMDAIDSKLVHEEALRKIDEANQVSSTRE